ncbi:hypothetical protein BGY98DRAFT_1010765 [Russula aff. rugulosa BPL654]|nr:hypothetical protein BGY98DRAFT_1010765 [Russula aff. rugulosa BPL654]
MYIRQPSYLSRALLRQSRILLSFFPLLLVCFSPLSATAHEIDVRATPAEPSRLALSLISTLFLLRRTSRWNHSPIPTPTATPLSISAPTSSRQRFPTSIPSTTTAAWGLVWLFLRPMWWE